MDLLAAVDTRSGVVLGRTVVERKSNEIIAFAPLLDRLDITDGLIAADALYAQDAHTVYLHQRAVHYVLTIKGRPRLQQQLHGLPWQQLPVVDQTCDRGHGRRETRTLRLAAVTYRRASVLGFPHARVALQIIRRRTTPGGRLRPRRHASCGRGGHHRRDA